MRLTQYTDYALRVLMYVGVKGDGLATIAEISAIYGISRNHLMKVVHALGERGYLRTIRGRNGGICLGKPANEIGLGEVVRMTEDDLALAQCFLPAGDGSCRIEAACVLRHVLDDALTAFLTELDRYTLADLLEPRPLARLLALEPPVGTSGRWSFKNVK